MWGKLGRVAVTAMLGTIALSGCAREAPDQDAPPAGSAPAGALRSELLVDATWLEEASRHGDVVVLHVAADSSDYAADHIPGAGYLPLSSVLVDRAGVPNELPPLDEVRAAFEARGVGDDRHVVIYGMPLHAARAFLALDVLGHERVSLLDGGLAAWRSAGLDAVGRVTTGAATLSAQPVPNRVWTAADVNEVIGDDGVLLLDARPPAQFSGPDSPGRIPGAQSLFWERTLVSSEAPVLRSEPELRALFADAGARPDQLIVTYCRTGMQASFLYFVARYLGHDVRIYDGSFAEWSLNPRLPTETDDAGPR